MNHSQFKYYPPTFSLPQLEKNPEFQNNSQGY